MSGTIPRPFREAARKARKLGWVISVTGKGHLKWAPPEGGRPIITPSTPGRGRSVANTLADFRRAGLL